MRFKCNPFSFKESSFRDQDSEVGNQGHSGSFSGVSAEIEKKTNSQCRSGCDERQFLISGNLHKHLTFIVM